MAALDRVNSDPGRHGCRPTRLEIHTNYLEVQIISCAGFGSNLEALGMNLKTSSTISAALQKRATVACQQSQPNSRGKGMRLESMITEQKKYWAKLQRISP